MKLRASIPREWTRRNENTLLQGETSVKNKIAYSLGHSYTFVQGGSLSVDRTIV